VELEEILEVAQVDSEQWVSMLAEVMKTFPATGSLNTDICEIDENRRIFSDLVNDLKKLGKLNIMLHVVILHLNVDGYVQ
jgi:negative elongation factor A